MLHILSFTSMRDVGIALFVMLITIRETASFSKTRLEEKHERVSESGVLSLSASLLVGHDKSTNGRVDYRCK